MYEYIVSVYISANHKMATTQLVKADNKDDATQKAIDECHAEGLETYGTDYCDWCG